MKIIIVASKQASKFLSNRKNLGFTDKHPVHFGDIVKGELDAGPFVWNGERWVPSSPHILIHSPQITNRGEAESLVASLQRDGDYETAIIGCYPYIAKKYLAPRLKESFCDDSVYLLSPSFEDEREETLRLRESIQRILNPESAEKIDVGNAGIVGAGKGNHQGGARHLCVTLTNTSMGGSTPTVIDVFFDEGDHLELDFRETNQETK